MLSGIGKQNLVVSDVAQQLFQDFPCLQFLRWAQQVIIVNDFLHFRQFFNQLRVNGGIKIDTKSFPYSQIGENPLHIMIFPL
ncbi:hypothetical protein SAMN04487828_1720 [Prevotella sp. lc2012]|jgi:hypothetical protein|nr:hypothetical protein SAMN04487828_1720 [Prevotella sp. lc2012]